MHNFHNWELLIHFYFLFKLKTHSSVWHTEVSPVQISVSHRMHIITRFNFIRRMWTRKRYLCVSQSVNKSDRTSWTGRSLWLTQKPPFNATHMNTHAHMMSITVRFMLAYSGYLPCEYVFAAMEFAHFFIFHFSVATYKFSILSLNCSVGFSLKRA